LTLLTPDAIPKYVRLFGSWRLSIAHKLALTLLPQELVELIDWVFQQQKGGDLGKNTSSSQGNYGQNRHDLDNHFFKFLKRPPPHPNK